MKTAKFIFKKIIIVETMLIILTLAIQLFSINIPSILNILITCLNYLTPISLISLILYIILSLLTSTLIEVALGIILGGIILYYLFTNIL